MFLSFGLLSSSLFVRAQIRVIDNKGTISFIDESKWTRVGTTDDIYNKFPGNVGIGTNAPVANLHNAGSTLFGTLNLPDFGADGDIGTAAATVDAYTSINIAQTTVGVTLTVPAPSNTTAGRILKINNTGTTAFSIGAGSIAIAQTVEYVWNGTAWSLLTDGMSSGTGSGWDLTGNAGITAGVNFLGTTIDVPMDIRSNNTTMLQLGRRQTLGLYDGSSTGLFPYNQPDNPVVYLPGGSSGMSALQFQADAASFYKPILFTDADGNFMMRGSAAGTDFFEVGSEGSGNNGQLIFTIGDDGDEPMIFRKYNYTTQSYIEMMRLQGTGLNNDVRVGINTESAPPNTTLDVNGDVAIRMGAYTAVTGNNNDIVIGNRSFIRITGPTGTFNITGIAGGYDGKMVILYSAATGQMRITDDDTNSTAANRIYTLTGGTISTRATGGAAVTLIYDASSQRWIVTSVQK